MPVGAGSSPGAVLTCARDFESLSDRVVLDFCNGSATTEIYTPFTKATWTVVEPEGLPQAIDRAIRVAMTPPVGPVHLAIYDRLPGA